jgi:hypothetical protein
MPTCKRCLMPEGKFGVELNGQDTCNYCACYDLSAPVYADPEKLRPRLLERLEKVKGKYEYDAVVGISGGKDSTYVLYKLVKDYGAKVLALTYENGFLTDLGKRNIKNAVEELGVDHVFHYPDWEVHKKFYRATLEKLGDPCLACAFAGFFLAIKLCHEKKIPYFITGRSPYQMFRNLFEGSKDLFIPMMKLNAGEHSFAKVAEVYGTLNEKITAWVGSLFDDPADVEAIVEEFYPDSSALTAEFAPEIVSFFLYEPYDEEHMKRAIEENLNYRRAEDDMLLSHLDCQILESAEYLYREVHGLSMVAQEVAVMLRRGELGFDEARETLDRRPAEKDLARSVGALCQRIGMSPDEFPAVVDRLKNRPPEKFDSR